jgi:hypothetical protein
MRRQSMSNTEAIVAQGMRPACLGEPFGSRPSFVPIEDTRYVAPRPRPSGVGEERFGGANIELCNHKGMLAK